MPRRQISTLCTVGLHRDGHAQQRKENSRCFVGLFCKPLYACVDQCVPQNREVYTRKNIWLPHFFTLDSLVNHSGRNPRPLIRNLDVVCQFRRMTRSDTSHCTLPVRCPTSQDNYIPRSKGLTRDLSPPLNPSTRAFMLLSDRLGHKVCVQQCCGHVQISRLIPTATDHD